MPATAPRNPADPVVSVTGATGFVGRFVVRELRSRGVRVRALVRDARKAVRVLSEEGVELVIGDVLDTDSMDELAAGAGAMVHLVGIRREKPGGITFRKLHVEATRNAVAAAERAGVRRYIQMSALGARPDAASAYHKTKWAAEEIVRGSSLAWTIVRPSLILGPGGEFMQMATGWARGTEPPKHFMPYFCKPAPSVGAPVPDTCDNSASVQPVSVADVALSIAAALERDSAIGEVYPLVGPVAYSWPQMLVLIRDATPGAKPKIKPRGVPGVFAHYLAWAMGKAGLGTLLPFGPSEPLMAIEDNTGSPAKTRGDLGVDPAPLDRVLAWSVST